MLAVQGILAATRARDLTGEGQLVETTLVQALTCRQNPQVRWLLRDGEELPSDGVQAQVADPGRGEHRSPHHRDPREVTLIGLLAECKDGRWIMHSLTEPHFFPAWITVLGFDWIWEDERFKGAPLSTSPTPTPRPSSIRLLQEQHEEEDGRGVDGALRRQRQRVRRRRADDPGSAAAPAARRRGGWNPARSSDALEVGRRADADRVGHGARPAPTPRQHTDEVAARRSRR